MRPCPSLRPVFPALALLFASSCFISVNEGGSGPRVTGSGVQASEVRGEGEFHAIRAAGAYRLEIELGSPREVVVSCDDNLLGYLETRVKDGALRLRTRCNYTSREAIHVKVRTPELDELDLSGSSQAQVRGLAAGHFALDVSGSSSVKASGRVDRLTLDSSGSSDLDLSELVARRATLDLSGSSSVVLHVEDELAVDSSGSSSVRYRGRPSVVVDQSGSTSVKHID